MKLRLDKIQMKFRKSKPLIKSFIVISMFLLVLVMFSSFTKFSTYSLISLDEDEDFISGEKTSFAIYLTATDPEQFKEVDYYRVQYGRWRIESLEGDRIISSGKLTTLSQGIYNSVVEVTVPNENSVFVAEMIEYQYSLSSEGNWLSDEGTVKASEFIIMNLKTCIDASECSQGTLCSGKLTECDEGLCQSYGECLVCEINEDCPENNECVKGSCYPIQEKTVNQKVQETLTGPISKPGQVQDGQPIAQTAPTYLVFLVISMWIVLGVLFWQINKNKKKIF